MIRTVKQYLESLNDGRQIWCLGEKVADVRTHPTLSSIIKTACMDYVLPNHPDFRDLFVTKNEDGEDVNFLLTSPKTARGPFEKKGMLHHRRQIRRGGDRPLHGRRCPRRLYRHGQCHGQRDRDPLYRAGGELPEAAPETGPGYYRRHHRCQRGQEPAPFEAEAAPGLLPEDRGQTERRHRGEGGEGAYQRHPLRQ